MQERNITINYCNNIKKAQISIVEHALNIKFGHNGTGKSTISEAIRLKIEGDDLKKLTPFSAADSENEVIPSVEEIPFQKVKVFNEEYIQQYLFKQDGFFDDSYKVFLRSQECDNLSKEIIGMLAELQESNFQGTSISNFEETLNAYTTAVKYSDSGLSKRGGLGEVLKGGGAGFEKYSVLDRYRKYYSSTADKVTSWAKWRTDGIKQMNGCSCPFCANDLDEKIISTENSTIKTVFKKSALEVAGAILNFLKEGISKGFIVGESQNILQKYMGDETKEEELYLELAGLGEETKYLQDKLKLILSFRPMNVTHDELLELEDCLQRMKIEERQISKFYTTDKTKELVGAINAKIEALLTNTSTLKSLFLRHNDKLKKLIIKRKDDINSFLLLAGFPYEFDILERGENKANTYIKPVGQQHPITDPKNHLSWGERNAFSLVMFMFDAVSENADLIVLDDPISSFDANKKFAVIRRMFDNKQDVTFRDKTVLMLTHEMQPIIDYIHGNFFKAYGLTTEVSAEYLENNDGQIDSIKIEDKDLLNVVTLTKQYAMDNQQPLYVRVINARKHIELTSSNYSNLESYNILSNLIHGRDRPEDWNKHYMSIDQIQKGVENLKDLICEDSSYEELCSKIQTSYLLQQVKVNNAYQKILAIRLLMERNEKFRSKLRRTHPEVSKFLNETNHIENDYVFQLNPEKFFTIPKMYLRVIDALIEQHKNDWNSEIL